MNKEIKRQGISLETIKTFGTDYAEPVFRKRVRKQGDIQNLLKDEDVVLPTKKQHHQ